MEVEIILKRKFKKCIALVLSVSTLLGGISSLEAPIQSKAAQTDGAMQWNVEKSYSVTKNGVEYQAYLSQDGKESWIYNATALTKSMDVVLDFPEKVEGTTVTWIGSKREFFPTEEDDGCFTIMGGIAEPWNSKGGKETTNTTVKEVKMSDSVERLADSSFAGFAALQKVYLSDKISDIGAYTFYSCVYLESIRFGGGITNIESIVKDDMKDFANLKEIIVSDKNETYATEDGVLFSKDKKILYKVPQAKTSVKLPNTLTTITNESCKDLTLKNLVIPKKVSSIESDAFKNIYSKKWKIAAGNKCYAMKKNSCIYNKKNGKLVLIFRGNKVVLPKQVKKIIDGFSVEKGGYKKLYLPKKLKKLDADWLNKLKTTNSSQKIYFSGKAPKLTGGVSVENPKTVNYKIYVPKKYKKQYKKWFKKQEYSKKINVRFS